MKLTEGYHSVPQGMLANVQTSLEMLAKPESLGVMHGPWVLEHLDNADLRRYRTLLHRVGDDYLWAARLAMSDLELERFLGNPRVEAYVLALDGSDEGILELDFRVDRECEISLFGVSAPLIGTGAGGWLMNRAIEIAWSHPIQRFWLHTCTLDHPNALSFYRRHGFRPFRRDIEVYGDPRVLGITPAHAAPGVPML